MKKDNFTFRWNVEQKAWKIFWGLAFILLAVLLILRAFGIKVSFESYVGEISAFAVIAGLALLAYAISKLVKGKIGEIFIPLAFIFMIFEKNIAFYFGLAENFVNNWLIFLCAILFNIGFSMIFHSHRSHHGFDGKKHKLKSKSQKGSIGSSVMYIDCTDFVEEYVENNLGSTVVNFENTEIYTGGGVLYIDNNLGSIVIRVPEGWRVKERIDNNLGSVVNHIGNNSPEEAPTITVFGDNNLGSVVIKND